MNEIEAIKLLEKIEWQTRLAHCHSVDSSGGRSQCHICWNEKYQGHRENCKLFQALALLREKPEPDYTKNIRANLKRWKLEKIGDCRVKSVLAWLEEVCFRYDYLVKRSAKLQAQLEEEFSRGVKEGLEQAAEIVKNC